MKGEIAITESELSPDQHNITTSLDNPPEPLTNLVGRARELALLDVALGGATSGHGQIMLISGEPGIGKTRLAEELMHSVKHRPRCVIWGRCYEWEGTPAYWLWIQVIRRLIDLRAPRDLCEDLGAGAADIAQIVPELHEHFPDLAPPPKLEPEQSRFRLFDAISTFLTRSAARQPLVIVLDDLHWADRPSLLLIQFLAQSVARNSILIIGAYRDIDLQQQPRLARQVAEIARERSCQRITLAGLSRTDVARLISQILDRDPPASLVDAVYQETEGNPFFMTEIMRLLIADGLLDPPIQANAWRIRIPESVRDVIGRRLDRLSDACNQTLATASVVGREFSVQLLVEITSQRPNQLLTLLDEGLQDRILHMEPVIGQYRFSHALIQDTLYQRLSSPNRVQLHRTVGIAIERLHAFNLAPHYAELAHHFMQAAVLGEHAKAIEYATRSGDQAMEQLALESAIGHYQRALNVPDMQNMPDQEKTCALLLALGDAQNRVGFGSGEAPAARATFLRALELARDLEDPEQFSRAALGYAGFNVVVSFGGERQIQFLEDALALLGDDDSALKVKILSRLAMDQAIVTAATQRDRIRALGDEAVAMSRRLDDPATLAFALAGRHFSSWGPDNLSDRLADAAELTELSGTIDDPLASFWGSVINLEDQVERGDIGRATHAMDRVSLLAEKSSVPYFTLRDKVYRAMLLLMSGRFAAAEPLIKQGAQLWQSEILHQHEFQLFVLRREQGRVDEMAQKFEQTLTGASPGVNLYAHIAPIYQLMLYLESGHKDQAKTQFEAIAAHDFDDVPFDMSWLSIMALLAEAAVALDDLNRARILYGRLLPYAQQNVLLAISAVCHGSVSYYLGLLATLLERWDAASKHFDDALTMHERMGMGPYVAHTLFAQASMLKQRGTTEDQQRSRDLAKRALNIARSLGMSTLEQKAQKSLAEIQDSARAEHQLTSRETEVLTLVAEGLTDAEISQALKISTRTVNAHMRSILTKLGVPSRAAATRVAIEHNLT